MGISEEEIIAQEENLLGKFKASLRRQLVELDKLKVLNEYQIEAFEIRNNINLPDEYRKFLLVSNGGYPSSQCFPLGENKRVVNYLLPLVAPHGYYDRVENYMSIYSKRYPSNVMLPIASAGGGDMILLGFKDEWRGRIFYWDHHFESDEDDSLFFENVENISSGLNNFLNMLI